ncbi:MAG TPA: type II toxin-antitoxin system RelE/ParE family toxin [Rhodoferax sp.]
MQQKRVFKTKTFDRWARKLLSDEVLCEAAREIEQGLYEADLGSGICKKRVAIAGKGKSGGTRTLVAKQHAAAIFFLLGREKSSPGTDFPDAVVEVAKFVGASLQNLPMSKLDDMTETGALKEICNAKKKQ